MDYNSGRRSAQLRHQMERNIQVRREHENYAAVWGSMKKYYDRWNSQLPKYNAWSSDNFKRREEPPSRINEIEDFKEEIVNNKHLFKQENECEIHNNAKKSQERNFKGPMSVYQREICDLAHWVNSPHALKTDDSIDHGMNSSLNITRLDEPFHTNSMKTPVIRQDAQTIRRYQSAKNVSFERDHMNDPEVQYETHDCPLKHKQIINHEFFKLANEEGNERKSERKSPEIKVMKNALELKIELDDLETDRTLVSDLLTKLHPDDKLATNTAKIKKDFLALYQRRLNSRPVDKLMLKELIQENVLQASESITFLKELTGKLTSKEIIKDLDPKISEAVAKLNGIKDNDEAKQRFVYTLFDEEARLMLKSCIDLMQATTETGKKPSEEDIKAYADPTRFDVWDWTLFYASFETIYKIPVGILKTILGLVDELSVAKKALLKELSPGTIEVIQSAPKVEANATELKFEAKENAKAAGETVKLSEIEKHLEQITGKSKENKTQSTMNASSIINSIIG